MNRLIDGVPMDKLVLSFTSERLDAPDNLRYSKMVVGVFVANVEVGSVRPDTKGDNVMALKYRVTDHVLLDGDERDKAIAFVAHGGQAQGLFALPNHLHEPDDDSVDLTELDDGTPIPNEESEPEVDSTTGEITFRGPEPEDTGFKVAKFNDHDIDADEMEEVVQVGSAYPTGRQGKDKTLQRIYSDDF